MVEGESDGAIRRAATARSTDFALASQSLHETICVGMEATEVRRGAKRG